MAGHNNLNCQIKNKMAGEILQICFTLFSYDISSSTTPLLNILSESMMTTATHIEDHYKRRFPWIV